MNQHAESAIAISAAPERVWQAWVEEINMWWTKPYYNDHSLVTGLHMEPGLGGRLIEKWGETGSGFLIDVANLVRLAIDSNPNWQSVSVSAVIVLARACDHKHRQERGHCQYRVAFEFPHLLNRYN